MSELRLPGDTLTRPRLRRPQLRSPGDLTPRAHGHKPARWPSRSHRSRPRGEGSSQTLSHNKLLATFRRAENAEGKTSEAGSPLRVYVARRGQGRPGSERPWATASPGVLQSRPHVYNQQDFHVLTELFPGHRADGHRAHYGDAFAWLRRARLLPPLTAVRSRAYCTYSEAMLINYCVSRRCFVSFFGNVCVCPVFYREKEYLEKQNCSPGLISSSRLWKPREGVHSVPGKQQRRAEGKWGAGSKALGAASVPAPPPSACEVLPRGCRREKCTQRGRATVN